MRFVLLRFAGIFKTRQGMTLIELVLSTALLSMLLAASFGFCSSGIKIYKQCLEELSNMQNARYAIYRLSVSISQAKEVKIISNNKIEIRLPDDSKVYYYLEAGTLYREKNGGKNPVAELSSLEFYRIPDSNSIRIVVKAGEERCFTLQTAVTAFGYWIGD